jgi:hypothetical protein
VIGEAWSYTNWADTQPNDSGPNGPAVLTFAYKGTPAGTWNDAMGGAGSSMVYVTEYVPQPASMGLVALGGLALLRRRRRRAAAGGPGGRLHLLKPRKLFE